MINPVIMQLVTGDITKIIGRHTQRQAAVPEKIQERVQGEIGDHLRIPA